MPTSYPLSQSPQHSLRFFRHNMQQSRCRAVRFAVAAFPMAKRADVDTKFSGKVFAFVKGDYFV